MYYIDKEYESRRPVTPLQLEFETGVENKRKYEISSFHLFKA